MSTITAATLTLTYSNGIPLALDARLEFQDQLGVATVSLPLGSGDTLDLLAAPTNSDGFASGTTDGEIEFGLAGDDLRLLASSRDLRIVITFASPGQSSGRIRASDSIRLSLRGDFQFNVTVGD